VKQLTMKFAKLASYPKMYWVISAAEERNTTPVMNWPKTMGLHQCTGKRGWVVDSVQCAGE